MPGDPVNVSFDLQKVMKARQAAQAVAQKAATGFWNAEVLGQLARQHLAGAKDFPTELNAALSYVYEVQGRAAEALTAGILFSPTA